MSIRITELDAINSLQDGDYVAVDNESTGTHKFKALNISANVAGNIANAYSSSASYAVGQYCLYNNNLYRCTTTISTPEAWNGAHWVQVTVGEGLYDKVDKVSGKALSANDFTNAYKTKLDGIEAGAEVNVQANWTESDSSKDDYIKNKPVNATQSTSGFMSASDKQKLDGIANGAEVNVQANWTENDSSKDDYIKNKPTIDEALNLNSNNAVRNSAITAGINQVQSNLNTEITNRQNAVSGEQTARENAINAEQLARENADNALDGRLDIVEETLPNKANIDGSYENMTVGNAEQLIATQTVEDSNAYIFRRSGGTYDIGNRETDTLVGGTIVWNQLVPANSKSATYTAPEDTSSYNVVLKYPDPVIPITANHKYLISGKVTRTISGKNGIGICFWANNVYRIAVGAANGASDGYYSLIYSSNTTESWNRISANNHSAEGKDGFNQGDTVSYDDLMVIDLTQMFGSTIADAIYAMEQAQEGSGVAWFKKYFPKPYYAYNVGSLQSVNVVSHDMTGFNQWDEEIVAGYFDNSGVWQNNASYISSKNPIRVLPNTTYCCYCGSGSTVYGTFWMEEVPSGTSATDKFISRSGIANNGLGTFTTPANCYAMHFNVASGYGTTYKNDICINFSSYRNGEYEEYQKYSYAYDSTVQLRGIPKLVNNELQYDGDIYESNGAVTRNYGMIKLGDLTGWYLDSLYGAYRVSGLTDAKSHSSGTLIKLINTKGYKQLGKMRANAEDYTIVVNSASHTAGVVYIKDNSFANLNEFITAMNSTYLVYELATSTIEEADPFINPQIVNDFGTEKYIDAGIQAETRDVAIPVGHNTQYMANLRDKLQHLPSLASEDGDYFVRQVGEDMSLKKVEGEYNDLVAGSAKQLISTIRANDQTPYLFRTSGGSVDIGDREYINGIVGGTVAWNQIYPKTTAVGTQAQGITFTVDNDGYVNIEGTSTETEDVSSGITPYGNIFPANHVWLGIAQRSGLANLTWRRNGFSYTSADYSMMKHGTDYNNRIQIKIEQGASYSGKIRFNVFDLTQMFGSTIADYIYALETNHAGDGIAWFKKLFPNPYYAYNAGELKHVSGLTSHDMTGFNQWDEVSESGYIDVNNGTNKVGANYIRSANYIPCIPNTSYYLYAGGGNSTISPVVFYDADKNYVGYLGTSNTLNRVFTTPSNAYYLRFYATASVYNHDICINLSWDGSRDGEYEPYELHSYSLDSDLTLRGIPKLDANNSLYYDGDTYKSDGTVTKKYKMVDLGTINWAKETDSADYGTFFYVSTFATDKAYGSNMICSKYTTVDRRPNWGTQDKIVTGNVGNKAVYIRDSSYNNNTAEEFKTAMNGIYLVYELAEPTTESADAYQTPQIVNDFGTEEFVIDSNIDVPIPVGHDTDYPINLLAKLEMSPNSPDGNGDYIVRQTNGTNEYVPLVIEDQLPTVPSTDGTYTLTVTIASGVATYSWT